MRPGSFSFIVDADEVTREIMNYLVFLDTRAGELERILSGLKTMLIKEFDPVHPPVHPLAPGDNLYFLRDQDDCALRVKATVVRVLNVTTTQEEDLSQTLKVMQPKLQLTEEQYNQWSAKQQVLLVEFGSVQKIGVIQVAPEKIVNRLGWIVIDDYHRISEQEVL
jgi:hypothetical protein